MKEESEENSDGKGVRMKGWGKKINRREGGKEKKQLKGREEVQRKRKKVYSNKVGMYDFWQ